MQLTNLNARFLTTFTAIGKRANGVK